MSKKSLDHFGDLQRAVIEIVWTLGEASVRQVWKQLHHDKELAYTTVLTAMQAGKKHGMKTLADSLYTLYMGRDVSLEECLRVVPDQNEFLRMVGEPVPDEEKVGAAAGRR